MKTEILTSELQKIIDPSVDGIYYKGKKIKVDLTQLAKYVNEPKKYNVFKLTDDTLKNLYKNLALYIINSNEPTLISLDLNNPRIFSENKGLFEYIKNIYAQQEKSFIELDEIGDNLLLIKGQNLLPLPDELSIEHAEDMHYATAATALASPELRQKTRGQIHWNDSNSELYGDLKFVVEKIKEQFPSSAQYYLNTDYETPFDSLIKKINPALLNSLEFKGALLEVDSEPLHILLAGRFVEKSDKYFIDFSQAEIQSQLLTNIQNKKFVALEHLFSLGSGATHNIREDIKKCLLQTIDFKLLLNQPEAIQYLVEKKAEDRNYYNNKGKGVTIKLVYPFLSAEYRTYLPVMEKYAKLICEKNMDRRITIYEKHLYELEPIAFNEKSVINIIAEGVNFRNLSVHLKTKGVECPLLSNTAFIMSLAENISGQQLADWIANFLNKADLNTNYIQSLVKVNSELYDSLKDHKSLLKFQKDINVIRSMANSNEHYNCARLSYHIMTPLLLEDHDEEFELIKVRYLIETSFLQNIRCDKSFKDLDLMKIKEKYHKPEYLFYTSSSWGQVNEIGAKSLNKLTKAEEVFEILEKIKKHGLKYTFQAQQFYEALPKALKRNKEVMFKILELGDIKYSSLESTLAYSNDIALMFLRKNPRDIQFIPEELFTNAKFTIAFARLVDQRAISRELIPSFVSNFFERHDIKNNFEEFIMQHLNYTSLQADLDKPTTPATTVRRVKI